MPENQKTNTPASASIGTTRQLLDELDSLMERMLALPVDDEGDEQSMQQSATATATVERSTAIQEEEEVEEPQDTSPVDDNEEIEEPANQTNYQFDEILDVDDSAEGGAPSQDDAAPERSASLVNGESAPDLSYLKPGPLTKEIISPSIRQPKDAQPETIASRAQMISERAASKNRWWIWPLSAMNRLFDFSTYVLGPAGNWLRQPGGRTFVGLLGVTLVLAAIIIQIMLWLTWN